MLSREYNFGDRVLIHWHQVTHEAWCNWNSKNKVWRTRCGIMFQTGCAPEPWARAVTCFACLVTEDIW